MYARFLRWASDRLNENGIIAFVSNNSFVDGRTYDGFRKIASREFSSVYIVDLKGNARTSGERRRREGGNVFSDQIRVGVAVYFLVKKSKKEGCDVFYHAVPDYARAFEKLDFLSSSKLSDITFDGVHPDAKNNWINLSESNDWEKLVPVCDKNVKAGQKREGSIFKLFSLGIATNRDEWVYDFDEEALAKKVKFFCKKYELEKERWKKLRKKENIGDFVDRTIKWTSELEDHLKRGTDLDFSRKNIRDGHYRPFVKMKLYFDDVIVHRMYQQNVFFKVGDLRRQNTLICINTGNKNFNVLASDLVPNNHFNGDSQCAPFYCYDGDGTRLDNITDWGLKQFQDHYKDKDITKEDLFHYVYAVLHNPAYRKKYEQNLKRDFPRIPFYEDFWKWSGLGKEAHEAAHRIREGETVSAKDCHRKNSTGHKNKIEVEG